MKKFTYMVQKHTFEEYSLKMWPIALKICTESSSEYVVKWPKALTARACATMLKVYVTTNPLLVCTP